MACRVESGGEKKSRTMSCEEEPGKDVKMSQHVDTKKILKEVFPVDFMYL